MNKNLTAEDKLRKLETNLKSAHTAYGLSGILTLVYIVRYIATGNFNFWFSTYIPEFFLKSADKEILSQLSFPPLVAYSCVAAFLLVFIISLILAAIDSSHLKLCLVIYALDFVCLIAGSIVAPFGDVTEAVFIDIILHCFVILFLAVGVASAKKLK